MTCIRDSHVAISHVAMPDPKAKRLPQKVRWTIRATSRTHYAASLLPKGAIPSYVCAFTHASLIQLALIVPLFTSLPSSLFLPSTTTLSLFFSSLLLSSGAALTVLISGALLKSACPSLFLSLHRVPSPRSIPIGRLSLRDLACASQASFYLCPSFEASKVALTCRDVLSGIHHRPRFNLPSHSLLSYLRALANRGIVLSR